MTVDFLIYQLHSYLLHIFIHSDDGSKTEQQINVDKITLEDCEMEVGAIVLRGNRMVLARSLNKEYQGLRIPSLTLDKDETPEECAIRAVTRYLFFKKNEN